MAEGGGRGQARYQGGFAILRRGALETDSRGDRHRPSLGRAKLAGFGLASNLRVDALHVFRALWEPRAANTRGRADVRVRAGVVTAPAAGQGTGP